MRGFRKRLFALVAITFAASAAAAPAVSFALQASQPAASAPGGALPEGSLRFRVTKIVRTAEFRTAENQPWQPLKEGVELPEGTDVRTKILSKVQMTIPPDQVVAVDQVSTVKLVRAAVKNGKLVSLVEMQGGRVRYEIEGGGVEHDATIRSPNATLAVRGTQVTLYDQPPFTPQAISLTGTARYRDLHKLIALGGKGHRAAVNTKTDNPAQYALDQSVIDPFLPRARTASESTLVTQLVSQGATSFFDPVRGIEVVRGGVPPPAQALANTLPGLNIFLSWTGRANLDLSVGLQNANEFLYPIAGLNHYPNGDNIPFDHQGGPHGGIEVANFPRITNANVDELFSIGASHISGATANATFSAFLNGKPMDVFDINALQFAPTLSATIVPHGAAAAELGLGQEGILLGLLANSGGGGGQIPPPPGAGVLPGVAPSTAKPHRHVTAKESKPPVPSGRTMPFARSGGR